MTLQGTTAKIGPNNVMALEIALQLVQGHKDNAQKGLVALSRTTTLPRSFFKILGRATRP